MKTLRLSLIANPCLPIILFSTLTAQALVTLDIQLIDAVDNGNLNQTKACLTEGTNVNAKAKDEGTILSLIRQMYSSEKAGETFGASSPKKEHFKKIPELLKAHGAKE